EAERGDYVLGLGEIDERKGLDRAIRAIATIDEDRRPRLVWVGNRGVASYQSYSEALADSLGVTFEPKILVSDAELRALLSGAIAMIYTSRLEPFGLAPLEAGACSLPVVAIAEGGVRETVFDRVNGLLSPHDDPVLIGSLISELVSDPSLAQSLGKRGRELVLERWDWDRSVSELETHLHKVIKQTMRENIQPIESPPFIK
ncbi:MAG: glycosyltransferase family 1 protein, partial [Armatimonadetes bacterium]|nr:glycosyltransferase family 1 protein [Armatimonadota bacterium]